MLCVGPTFIEYPAWVNMINCVMDRGFELREVRVNGSYRVLRTQNSNSLTLSDTLNVVYRTEFSSSEFNVSLNMRESSGSERPT